MQGLLRTRAFWLTVTALLFIGYAGAMIPMSRKPDLPAVRQDADAAKGSAFISRQRTSDAVHKETDLAYTAFNNDPGKWAFPSAEGQFNKGTGALVRFKRELGKTAEVCPPGRRSRSIAGAAQFRIGWRHIAAVAEPEWPDGVAGGG